MSGDLPKDPFLAFARAWGGQMDFSAGGNALRYWQAAVIALRAYELERSRSNDSVTVELPDAQKTL